MIMIVLRVLSVLALLTTVASLAIPPVGQHVTNVIVGLWRRAPIAIRLILMIPIALLLVFVISGLVIFSGFAFHEPWAAWAGLILWTLFFVPALFFARSRPIGRAITTSLLFLALVSLGTTLTDIGGRTVMLIATFAVLLWFSRDLPAKGDTPARSPVPYRRAMIAFSVLVIVMSVGLPTVTSYIPAPISAAVGNLKSVSGFAIADAINPDIPAELLEMERAARGNALVKELANYQRIVDSLDAVRSTRSLTNVEWAMYQHAFDAVVRINREMSADRVGSSLPVGRADSVRIVRVLVLILLVLLFVAAMWILFFRNHGAAILQETTPPTQAEPAGQGDHGFSRLPWGQLAAVGAIAIALLGIGVLANDWLGAPPALSVPAQPTTQTSDPDLAQELTRSKMVYKVTEDTAMYDVSGEELQDVSKGTLVVYAGPGEEPDPAVLGGDAPVRVTLRNGKNAYINSATGFISAFLLKKLVEEPAPPPASPPVVAASSPAEEEKPHRSSRDRPILRVYNGLKQRVYLHCATKANGGTDDPRSSDGSWPIDPRDSRWVSFDPDPVPCDVRDAAGVTQAVTDKKGNLMRAIPPIKVSTVVYVRRQP